MLILPFSTYFREHPDMDALDTQAEIEMLFQRQQAVSDLLEGKTDAATVLDLLESQEINPLDYLEMVESNVEHLTNL